MDNSTQLRTIRLTIAFDGTDYFGWQIQPNAPTIQGEIERHLHTIHNGKITLHGSGRTDSGVHALAMVAHFHTEKSLSPCAFQKALNSMLPSAIRIVEAAEAHKSFHARFSAKAKTYIYSIYNGEILPPHKRLYTVQIRKTLNLKEIQSCLSLLCGTHDFASFETAGSRDQSNDDGLGSVRTIMEAELIQDEGEFYTFLFTGSGFLRHMVRNIVGTLLEVGLGRRSFENFRKTLFARKRSEAGATAPAHGLFLKKVHY